VNGAFRSLPIEAKGAVIGAAAVIGGIFVSALAAGILLGLGGGVLALGIKSALADPKVTAAWSTFGERAKKATAGFTNAFKGPVARAAGTFGAAIERMGPAFTRIGQTIAPVIDKLAPALADMAERAMPGIEKAITASVPLFLKLAEKLPALGDSITSFFDSVSAAAPAALLVLGVLMDLIGGVIRYWGNGIEFWSKTLVSFKDAMVAAKNWIVGVWNSVVGFVSGLPGRISKAASGMWNGIKNSFRSAVNWIIARWNSLSFTVGGGSIMGVGIPSITLNTPDIPMLAKGGIATTPGLAVVGERGPELVSLTKGAQVTPLPARGRGPARGELELVGEREVVAFVRRLIKQYRLVEG
jgi:phage-related protein